MEKFTLNGNVYFAKNLTFAYLVELDKFSFFAGNNSIIVAGNFVFYGGLVCFIRISAVIGNQSFGFFIKLRTFFFYSRAETMKLRIGI